MNLLARIPITACNYDASTISFDVTHGPSLLDRVIVILHFFTLFLLPK